MSWACSVYGGEDRHIDTGFWWVGLREGDHLGDPDVDGRIILRWVFRKWDVGAWTELIWLSKRTGGGHFKSGNEPLGSIQCGEFLDYLRTC